jgi:hypothetical protein
VIIWLNGTFGAGKTTTGMELAGRLANARLFDPEEVGYLLMRTLEDHEFRDFQDLAPWRELVPVFTEKIALFTGQHLIAVQWRLDHISDYEKARPWMESAADLVLDATHLPAAEVAERIAVEAKQRMADAPSLYAPRARSPTGLRPDGRGGWLRSMVRDWNAGSWNAGPGTETLERRPWNADRDRYSIYMSENPLNAAADVGDHQVITRAGQVEAVVVPLEEYRALKALEQREAELYWAVHEARYPSRPGDDVPETRVYDSMEALLADLDLPSTRSVPITR